jgi:uncharacterized glyoxalase superfamily protein PhnB
MQTIFPILRYKDARAAIQWLCDAFGFTLLFSVPESGGIVRHAQLRLGTNRIMLGSLRDDEPDFKSPLDVGLITQALSVYVADVEAHYERAQSASARVISPPMPTDFGAYEYHVRDLEGHVWTFSTFLPASDET